MNGDHFHWDSGLMHEQVLGDPAEIERFVSSPYSNIEGELELEAVVKVLGDSNGLGLAFRAEIPSGKFEELADIKTRKMSRGNEPAYKAKLKPEEDGYSRLIQMKKIAIQHLKKVVHGLVEDR